MTVEKPHPLVTATRAYLGLRFDVDSRLQPDGNGTLLELPAETHWPRGIRPLGKLVELAILSRREGRKELARLKVLVERESRDG